MKANLKDLNYSIYFELAGTSNADGSMDTLNFVFQRALCYTILLPGIHKGHDLFAAMFHL
jgi:hypothetical protein